MYGTIYRLSHDKSPFADCKRRVARASNSSMTGLSRLLRSSRRKNRLQSSGFQGGQNTACMIGVTGYMNAEVDI